MDLDLPEENNNHSYKEINVIDLANKPIDGDEYNFVYKMSRFINEIDYRDSTVSYSPIDSILMRRAILSLSGPLSCFEFAGAWGFSSRILIESLRERNDPFVFTTVEMDENRFIKLRESVGPFGQACHMNVFDYDFSGKNYDLLLFDGEHDAKTANFYLKNILSRLNPGGGGNCSRYK